MANYHVNYNTGSDATGDGSTGSPWATINHALSTSSATTGDVVKVVGSTTTDLDTTASFTTLDRTNELTTTTDLTSSLAVGDIIIISPNITDGAEFNGWMHTEVQAITATTLTTRGYHMYPNQTNLNVTITKVNDAVLGNSQETITGANNYAGAVVECGYDATFTTVIGRTYWVNSSVSVGGRSGRKFDIPSNGSIGEWSDTMPLFRNIAFARFEHGLYMQFGRIAYANNIVLLNAKAQAGGQQNYQGPLSDTTTDLYINDCDGAILDKNYYVYAVYGSTPAIAGAPIHAFINQNRDRQMERNGGYLGNVTSYTLKGGPFGFNTPFPQSYNLVIKGDIVIMGIDSSDFQADYYRTPAIAGGTAFVYMDSFKIVRNGKTAAQTPFCPVINSVDNAVSGQSLVKFPTGTSISDLYIVGAQTQEQFQPNETTFIDDDGTWIGHDGTIVVKQNTTDQETGNSCLELKVQPGEAYAGGRNGSTIIAFPAGNGVGKLSSLNFRYKKLSGTYNSVGLIINIGGNYQQATGSIQMGQTDWANYERSLSQERISNWITNLPDDVLIRFSFESGDSDTDLHTLIDSITPTYS